MHSTPSRTPDIHPAARAYAAEVAAGTLSRREFLTRAMALGVTATMAYGLIGLQAPARAQDAVRQGGTLRIESTVKALKDPRSFDWQQMSNFTRGWLEYLVEYRADGGFDAILLERWEVNADATEYVLTIRSGVTWSNGDPFTAADVAFNITRWCDKSAEGNSMASRMASLIDAATDQIRDDVLEIVDDVTLIVRPSMPDITLIAGFSDYPAAIVHPSFSGDPLDTPIGTGPYMPESLEVGVKSVLLRNEAHTWWGKGIIGEAALDRIEYIDFGDDMAGIFAAADADEIDMVYESLGEFIELFDSVEWIRSEAVTANTVLTRANQMAEIDGTTPYADVRVRRALAMAVDNAVCLELGYSDLGTLAENHHVCPIHPEYAELPAPVHDPEGAMALMTEAGMQDYVHELISIDDDWRRATTDSIAAQLRDAGFKVERKILPGNTFWNDWAKYAFSTTDWAQRPLGVQVLALAYRSGAVWNESGFANEEFDTLLEQAMAIADADTRRGLMQRLEEILQEQGVIIQPYWRSTFRHAKPQVVGAEMHPLFDIHVCRLGWAA